MSLLKHGSYASLGQFISEVVGFATAIILVRGLTQSGYGRFTYVIGLTSVFVLFTSLKIPPLYNRFIPTFGSRGEGAKSKYLVIKTLKLATGLSVIGSFAFFLYIAYADIIVGESWFLVLIFSSIVLIKTLFSFLNQILSGYQIFKERALVDVVQNVSQLILLLILFIAFKLATITALLAILAGIALSVILGLYFLVNSNAWAVQPEETDVWGLYREYSLPLLPEGVFKKLLGFGPIYILTVVLGFSSLGAWQVAFKLGTAITLIQAPFKAPLTPKIAEIDSRGHELTEVMEYYYRYALMVTVPFVAGGLVTGDKLVKFVFTHKYVESILPFKIMLFYFAIMLFNGFTARYFLGRGLSRHYTAQKGLKVALLLPGVLIGAYFAGLPGAAIAYVCTISIVFLVSFGLVLRREKFRFRLELEYVYKPLVATGMMSAVVYLLYPFVRIWWSLLLLIGLGAVTYFLSLLFTGYLNDRDFELLEDAFGGVAPLRRVIEYLKILNGMLY